MPGPISGSLAPPNEVEAKQLRDQERARTASMSSHAQVVEPVGVDYAATNTVRRKPSLACSMAASAAPQSFRDLTAIYNVVSERRNAFDSLLWHWYMRRPTTGRVNRSDVPFQSYYGIWSSGILVCDGTCAAEIHPRRKR